MEKSPLLPQVPSPAWGRVQTEESRVHTAVRDRHFSLPLPCPAQATFLLWFKTLLPEPPTPLRRTPIQPVAP